MKYTRKSYRKKSAYRRKRKSYRKRSFRTKRMGTKQMENFQNIEKVVLKQLFDIEQKENTGGTQVNFSVNLLNQTTGLPAGVQGFGPAAVQSDLLQAYIQLYEEMTIDAVGIKLIFPDSYTTTQSNYASPISWCIAYSNVGPIGTGLAQEQQLMSRGGSQAGPIPMNKMIKRYYSLAKIKRRYGIAWTQSNTTSYFGQLPANVQPSVQAIVEFNENF